MECRKRYRKLSATSQPFLADTNASFFLSQSLLDMSYLSSSS